MRCSNIAMKKYFYSHLVEMESVVLALDELEISEAEKEKLAMLADKQLAHVVIGAILNELTVRDKKIFLANLRYEENDKIWKHLRGKVEKIEEKIIMAAEDLKYDLHKDIGELKNKKQ